MKAKSIFFFCILTINSLYSQFQIGNTIVGSSGGNSTGRSLSISSDGNRLAVASPRNDDNGNNAGKVQVFDLVNNVWTQIGQDIFGETNDDFGTSIDISSDGKKLVIGAAQWLSFGEKDGYVKAYQFNNVTNLWEQIGNKITDNIEDTEFGASVSISDLGDKITVGTLKDYYVKTYHLENNIWEITGNIIDDLGFGNIKSKMSPDGNSLIVGVSNNGNIEESLYEEGFARVYYWINNTWVQIGSDIVGDFPGDWFGVSVDISNNGQRIIIGGFRNDNNGDDTGHAKIYRNILNSWEQLGEELVGDLEGDLFGIEVSISGNGNIISIGATENDQGVFNGGLVKNYFWNEQAWIQVGQSIIGQEESARLGRPIVLSEDGSTAALGVPLSIQNDQFATGRVLVYNICQNNSNTSISSCNNFVLSNNEIVSNSGIYLDTLQNQFGCDSILTIDLIIIPNDTTYIFESECEDFLFGDSLITESGIYSDTLTNSRGCDSIIILDLEIIELETTIEVIGSEIIANTGNNYDLNFQWINCETMEEIEGAINSSFSPTQSGVYGVIVSHNDCVQLSECIEFIISSQENITIDNNVVIFPNPSNSNKVIIDFKNHQNSSIIKVISMSGEVIKIEKIENQDFVEIEINNKGVYILEIITEHYTSINQILII